MKFDSPATTNPIDQLKVVGKPVDRIDGPIGAAQAGQLFDLGSAHELYAALHGVCDHLR